MAQGNVRSLGAWHFTSFTGNVGLRGNYLEQKNITSKYSDYLSNPYLSGNLELNTSSYIWHPNFLRLELGGEFNPGTEQRDYLISPDHAEVRTQSKIDIRGYLFSAKSMNISGQYNYGRSFANRENLNSVKSQNKVWGLSYSYGNKILPLRINYLNSKWDQRETETDRTYKNEQTTLNLRTSKSFGIGDNSELRISRMTNYRVDQNDHVINLTNDDIVLTNTLHFDKQKRYLLRSSISNMDRQGTINQQRFRIIEQASFKLPLRLMLSGNYNYSNINYEQLNYRNNNISVNLGHQLYSSLKTHLNYDYFSSNQQSYNMYDTKIGTNLNYTKKIPTGRLTILYSYRRQLQSQNHKAQFINIIDERHTLNDGEIALLDNPNVITASILVKDPSGVIIYQENFDYVLIDRGNYHEIQRIPGGQIINGSIVLVNYSAEQVGSFKYVSNYNNFSVRVNLFRNLLDLYYTHTNRKYVEIESTNLVTLNPFMRHSFGTRINVSFISGGIEYEDYISTRVPYKKLHYFVRMNTWVGKKMIFSLNGSLTDLLYNQINSEQIYAGVYGNIIYKIQGISSIKMDLGYRTQTGEQINLDLFTAKMEYNSAWRKLYFKLGIEVYKRNYIGTELNFGEVYFQIDRRF